MQHDNALMVLEKIRQEISTLDSLVWQKEHQEAGVITNRLLGLTKDLTQALEAQDKPTVAKNATTQAVDVEENFDCQELLKVIDKAWYGYGNAKESVVHIVKESFAITPPSEGA